MSAFPHAELFNVPCSSRVCEGVRRGRLSCGRAEAAWFMMPGRMGDKRMTRGKDRRPPAGEGRSPPRVARVSALAYWSVAGLSATAAVLSAFLVLKHFGGGVPGCGPASGCEALEKSPWGTLPGARWPVSFAGLAYFAAVLAGWLAAGRQVPVAGRWVLRAGAAASLLFSAVMIAYGTFCPYCIGVHAANLLAVAVIEQGTRRAARLSSPGEAVVSGATLRWAAWPALGAFLAVSLVLGMAEARFERKQAAVAESDRRESTDEILAQVQAQSQHQVQAQSRVQVQPQAQSQAEDQPQVRSPDSGAVADGARATAFTGRYRLGPEECPIRVVALTDYQCADCQRVEREIEEMLSTRKDISFSVKQFPMCAEAAPGVPCNRHVKQTLHANACWAARVAEAAGILRGNEGFWQMHRWLFARRGGFTDAELKAGLAQMGYDHEAFLSVLGGADALQRVRADCEEGNALGLFFTPMVFINGVEFKGWQVPGALRRTIEEIAARNPPALRATADRPVPADTKSIQDWRDQPVRKMLPDTRTWSMGAPSADAVPAGTRFVDVVLFGDYQEPYTAAIDAAIRDRMKTKTNVRYTFRHYPIDPVSNPTIPPNVRPEAVHPLAGRAARAAEAAGSLGGDQAYWRMHDWLMRNVDSFGDESLRAAARRMGLDPDSLFVEMGRPEAAAAIVEDARAAQQLGLTGVPMVFVNGRWVWRTMREEKNVVLQIIDAAGSPRP